MADETSAPPAISGSTHTILFDLKLLTQFDEQQPAAKVLAETGAAQVVLLAMRAGQAVRDVQTPSQIIAQCLRGRATLHTEAATQALRAGLVALIESETLHTFIATTDCVLLLTLTPSPEQRPAHAMLEDAHPLVKRL